MTTAPDAAAGDEGATLLAAALAARAHAYSPYSGFAVGAAILGEDGRIFLGCNVENASYPVGTCAEAGAIAAMVAGGTRRLAAILVVGGEGPEGIAPCGACRQRILEFSSPGARIHCAGPGGVGRTFAAADLLPGAFGASDLRR